MNSQLDIIHEGFYMKNSKDKSDTSELLKMLCMEQWSNSACSGYAILACRRLNFTKNQTNEFLSALNFIYEQYAVDEATHIYMDF